MADRPPARLVRIAADSLPVLERHRQGIAAIVVPAILADPTRQIEAWRAAAVADRCSPFEPLATCAAVESDSYGRVLHLLATGGSDG